LRIRTFAVALAIAAIGTFGGGVLPAAATLTPANTPNPVGEFLLLPGMTLQVSGAQLSACDGLTWGYEVGSGPLVQEGSLSAGCATVPTADPTIGPFPIRPFGQLFTVVFWLTDTSYGPYTYYSTGNHALVTGSLLRTVDITDSGEGAYPPGDARPPAAPGDGNLSLKVVTCFVGICGIPPLFY